MKKYNLSEIMKKAWEIRKTNKKSFSENILENSKMLHGRNRNI